MLGTRIEERAESLADELCVAGWAVRTEAVDLSVVQRLRQESQARWDEDAFRMARVGTADDRRLAPEIRSDRILWIEPTAPTPGQAPYLELLEEVRLEVNRRTFMGLHEWEGHLAVYPPGAGYRRHLDVFSRARERKVSTILYLNEAWAPGDGGELRIWLDPAGQADRAEDRFIDIEPRAGTLVTFLSEDFYHAVLPTAVQRNSVTGWFRVRAM